MGTDSTDCMLLLAAEAFQSKNFGLAADIYECQLLHLCDPSTQQHLLVKRADALAFAGKLTDAFDIYRKAAEIERLRPVHLDNLIEYLSNSIKRQDGTDSQNNRQETHSDCVGYDAFTCKICYGFLYEPVTLPCGHCFCKKCLDREKMPVCCKECNDSRHTKLNDVDNYRVNVVLSNLLSKWFPTQLLAVNLRREGNGLYSEKIMDAALEKYNEAIQIAPRDHVLYSNRSQINSSLRNYKDALHDAEMACKLMPLWSKGHIRKAQALVSLGKCEEALREYLVVITLDPESKLAKRKAQKILSDLLAPVTDQVHNRILDYTSLLSSRNKIKGGILNTSTSSCNTTTSSKSYKDYKNIASHEKLTSSPTLSEPKTDGLFETMACGEKKGEDQVDLNVCHPTVIDRSVFLKRKRSSSEDSQVDSSDNCKRSKSEVTQSEETTSWSAVLSDLIDPADLECSLCMRLFYEPVTTPCGHTFCLKCLERCLDHNPKCPLCKMELEEYLAESKYNKTVLMENLICKYLPIELMDRQKVNAEEIADLSNLNKNVPIFVCTMAFPTVPCPLHIFEPCYRLMIRRCMEMGTKQFGMCLSDNLKGFADYGSLLEIRNVEFFADGRSVVDTIGIRRFKVVEHHQRDGYNTADIEYLEDVKVEVVAEKELQSLHDAVYDQALIWVNSLKAEQKERIVEHFGRMPEKDSEPQASPNGPSWCWWLLAVLPLEGRAQLPFLALTSLKDRLSGIRRVLLFMSRNRSSR
ncbi:LON peptidase N-terminal domain and RING finger protein 3 isoform X1 [Salmo salar]|uniref:LON peptidase N-terminal domain and RING finger protein 3 isoform X1 n=2 Tax=Salmo salar TaxID=8030 RepID=A0A1S3RUT2_SALSA|nr:LON peptidase N-terminal domain and RING finger protein 3 isoform X1 [Salmo salar]|eukprot:XP_014055602.1 PREDICTED: LON peptidase N-terminal domain and RING finger protein 3 isoform X1 [Salmo salar]